MRVLVLNFILLSGKPDRGCSENSRGYSETSTTDARELSHGLWFQKAALPSVDVRIPESGAVSVNVTPSVRRGSARTSCLSHTGTDHFDREAPPYGSAVVYHESSRSQERGGQARMRGSALQRVRSG